ncbi:protein phosphatase [Noviherbaspirillum humi]|uniref:Protein phosphatase n=1 Tax=Noviherbaspirillum humi TaxID=1688639 RepID=A0A239E2N2_9BURK|nr:PP2C family serine/threonine-protein phosphatase [Noviherbaspirillum humi]SNS38877.1 protein phosphatase [Noviherbaspirillum humi]
MEHPIGLEFFAETDIGLVRSRNEDAFAISPEQGFAILADGMGGHNAGEVASTIAIKTIRRQLENFFPAFHASLGATTDDTSLQPLSSCLDDAVMQANAAILRAAENNPEYFGMGTTVVVAAFHGGFVTIAHVGDSRLYRLREGRLEQLTLDHSLLQRQIDQGRLTTEQAGFLPVPNRLTRAVGVAPALEIDIQRHAILPGDVYLLCSDGLTDMLSDADIRQVLAQEWPTLAAASAELIVETNTRGSRDNTTIILVRALALPGERGRQA